MPLEAQMFGGKEQDWEQLAGRLRSCRRLHQRLVGRIVPAVNGVGERICPPLRQRAGGTRHDDHQGS